MQKRTCLHNGAKRNMPVVSARSGAEGRLPAILAVTENGLLQDRQVSAGFGESSDMTKASEPLRRAAAIVEFVAMEPAGVTVARLAENFGLPAATAYRVVRRLVDIGFLEGEGRHAAYVIGPALRRIANMVQGGGAFSAMADLVLQQIADRLGVSIYLAGFFENEVSLIQVKNPVSASAPSVHPGPTFRMHASASGKLLLAHQPAAVIDAILAKPLDKLTERTVTDPSRLRTQLDDIRQTGFALSIGESDPSLWGIAVPVRDVRDHVVFAVGLITFSQTIADDRAYIAETLPVLRQAASRISDLSRS